MQDLRNLYNQALSAVGAEPNVTDPTANTKSTSVLNLWYPVARHAVFTAFHWPSLRVTKRLARAGVRDTSVDWANTDPMPGFQFSFALPSDLLLPQYMTNFQRFQIGRVGTERLIFSNDPNPILNYTIDEDTPIRWESELYRCVLWTLAGCINMSKNGKMALTQKLEQQVREMIEQAAMVSSNSDETYYESPPSFYNNTGFSIPGTTNRFYYPTNTYSLGGLVP